MKDILKNRKLLIVAEIGVNHNGSLKLAKKMISAAKKSGADAVKIQTFNTSQVMKKNSPLAKFQKKNVGNKDFFDVAKSLELNKKNHIDLINYCNKKKIIFFSTPCDLESAKLLKKLKIKIFKTASADIDHFFLHDYLSTLNEPVIISTGMSKIKDIENVLKIYKKRKKKNIYLLHCISSYPTKHEDVNLNILDTLKKYNYGVGFSDHTSDYMSSCIAVAKGARIIEKHFTINKNLKGLDHKVSNNEKEFSLMVKKIRETQKIIGNKNKNIFDCEKNMYEISKKSIHLSKNLNKNDIIKKDDLDFIRPGNGISAMDLKKVIKKRLKKNLNKGFKLNTSVLK